MTIITNAAALEKLNAAVAGGVEPEWEADVAAIASFFSANPEAQFNTRWSNLDLFTLVKKSTGVEICDDVAYAAMDIISE